MRLIDADALMHEIEKIKWNLQMLDDTQSADKVWSGVRMAEKKVESAPTIDAVPVIRCKDCVHYRIYQLASDGETITDCAVMPCHPPKNWYCSNAERKDNER